MRWQGLSEIRCCSSAEVPEHGDHPEPRAACAEDAVAGRRTCLPAPG